MTVDSASALQAKVTKSSVKSTEFWITLIISLTAAATPFAWIVGLDSADITNLSELVIKAIEAVVQAGVAGVYVYKKSTLKESIVKNLAA